jgi:hypothetical protein
MAGSGRATVLGTKALRAPAPLVATAVSRPDSQSADASKQDYSQGMKIMTLTAQEHERIREEELLRWQVREEIKRKRGPWLIPVAIVWTATLTALAFFLSAKGL